MYMWKVAMLLMLCGIAWGVLSLFENGAETTLVAVLIIGGALGYLYSTNKQYLDENE